MSRFVKLSLLALTCMALLATKAMADELEDVTGEVPLPTGRGPQARYPDRTNYKTEAMLLAVVAGLVANYLYGSRRNQSTSKAWEQPITDVLRQNFTLVGDGKQVLEWDSPADLLFYASGRRHCKFVQGHMQLSARQDLEKIEIEVTLNDDAPGFVFAAVPRKRSKGVCRDRYDISTFAKIANNDKVSPKVAIISEIADATQQLLARLRKLAKSRDEAYKESGQEALAKALAEKRKNELEDVERMTPEQRRKWEEKDRKKQLKKEQSRRTCAGSILFLLIL
ncbi:hypothetical protein DL89DRAFT_269010 [Linderina pennispora]|uniref:DUF1682-domain-containing protein n=1 Tax=Linderina pennispora TaxID=61395 RepID=A0A1Y1W3F0_9FUNG|nr:uncharacterized protein DL89DRAFT_269010 [Linderina pennispora]ORX67816.1 hypothetical protein DL89DRAFT_269010 [Linderina pennispora]